MRKSDYIRLSLRNIRRQPLRSTLTIGALVISTAVLVLMLAIGLGGSQLIRQQFGSDDSLSLISVTPTQSAGALSPFGDVQQVSGTQTSLMDNTVSQLAAIPKVKTAYARAHIWELDSTRFQDSDKDFVANVDGISSTVAIPLSAGGRFISDDAAGNVIVGYAYAKQLGLADAPQKLIGKELMFTTQKGYRGQGATIPGPDASKDQLDAYTGSTTKIKATIVGVTQEGPDQNALFMPLGWAHQLRTAQYYENGSLKTKDQLDADGYSSIQVRAASLADVASVSGQIKALGYGQSSLLAQAERVQQLIAVVWLVMGSIAVVALVAAALGVVNTMLMVVSEQRFEIGVWRASGARRRVIVRLFLLEAAELGFFGGLAGSAIAVAGVFVLNHYASAILASQGVTAASIADASPLVAGGAVVLAIVLSVIAGLYPAYRAARVDPSSALSAGQ